MNHQNWQQWLSYYALQFILGVLESVVGGWLYGFNNQTHPTQEVEVEKSKGNLRIEIVGLLKLERSHETTRITRTRAR